MFDKIARFLKYYGDSGDGPAIAACAITETPTVNAGEIRQRKNGKFVLLANGNEVVAEYSRYRDAIRGADRRGIYVVS